MKRFLFNCLLQLAAFNAIAQQATKDDESDYVVEEFKLPGGRLGNNVNAIVQGPNGFLWFASHNGLHRYDGYEIFTYKKDPADTMGETTSLTFAYIENLYWDRQNILWVCTYGDGIFSFDPVTEKFKHFKHDPKDITSISHPNATCAIEDTHGNLWFGTEHGLNRFDRQTGKFKRYLTDPNNSHALHQDDIRSLYVDKRGTMWMGSGFTFFANEHGALSKYNPDTDSFINYYNDPADKSSLPARAVRGICEDDLGNFWIGVSKGLCKMDRENGTFELVQKNRYQRHAPEGLDNQVEIVYPILQSRFGGLWIGTILGSQPSHLTRFDPESGSSVSLPVRSSVWGLCESNDGTIWATGSGVGGRVFKIYKKEKKYNLAKGEFLFKELSKTDLYKNLLAGSEVIASGIDDIVIDKKRNVIWVEGSISTAIKDYVVLASVDNATGSAEFHFLRDLPLGEDVNEVASTWASHGMAVDHTGNIWGIVDSDSAGIYRYNPETKTTMRYFHHPKDPATISSNNLVYLMMDSRGEIWTGAVNAGLNRLDPTTGRVKQYHFNKKAEYDFPAAIMEDKEGMIWVGGDLFDAGSSFLAKINPNTDEIKKIALPGKDSVVTVFGLAQSPKTGAIIFCIQQEGIGVYQPQINSFSPLFSSSSGFFGNVVDAECDQHGVIWAAGVGEILRTDENGNGFILKDASEATVQPRSGITGPDGKIYFTTRQGTWLEIDPKSIEPTQTYGYSDVQLVDLIVQGRKITTKAGSILSNPLWMTDRISLPSSANSFLLKFSDFDFHNANPQFEYRLYPYETEWKKTINSPTANYYLVPPGTYHFQVHAVRQNGQAQAKVRELTVVVLPPWWKTWWAYSSYALLLTAGVALTHRIQKAKVIRKERERTKEKELAQAKEIEKAYHALKATQAQLIQSEKMASLGELTAGIAHEIQNPLNFVNNFSEVNSELIAELKLEIDKGNLADVKTIANNIDENEKKIIFHGKRADGIVKGMLQHSRSSSGVKEPTDINALADEYLRLAYHGLRAKDKSFNATMKTDFDPTIGSVNVVPQDIGRVVLNLITNAFYAVTDKRKSLPGNYEPTVTVETKRSDNKILIVVKDNGKGIPQNVRDKIFQPFFTTKPSGQGTGLGLSLSYDIVKAHGGELKVETKVDEGAEFIIILPIV